MQAPTSTLFSLRHGSSSAGARQRRATAARAALAAPPSPPPSAPPALQRPAEAPRSPWWRLASSVVYGLEKALVAASGGPEPGPNRYLRGNFAPVLDERFDTELEVLEGELPAALNGAFLRNGPNPALPPLSGYHWFDGDGMVHAVRIKDGKALAYSNAWIDTARLRQEREAGHPQFIKFGDSKGVSGVGHSLLRILKRKLGVTGRGGGDGTGNTALAFHAGKLLALHEGDLPYQLRLVCEGLVQTLGRLTFGGEVQHCFTAHPKVDPETGELLFFGYSVEQAPYCWLGVLDAQGNLAKDFEVPLPGPIMMHDFAITKDYVIFYDASLLFKPEAMVKEGASPFTFDKERPTRFGVLPRSATDASQIRWFETRPLVAFHTANAYQEGDKLKVFLCTFDEFDLDMSDFNPATLPYLSEVTLDLSSFSGGSASVRRVADVPGDFPRVPDSLVGRKTRYTYLGVMAAGTDVPTFTGIAKLDLQAADPSQAVAGLVEFGPQRFGGEAYFVPAAPGSSSSSSTKGSTGNDTAEDAGYLVTFVHDDSANQTELVVYNAASMMGKPVARVRMPRRVPYGFHCLHISEEQLQAQLAGAV